MRFAWIARPDFEAGSAHGGNLRLFSMGRALLAGGHRVHLVVRRGPGAPCRVADLERLVATGVVSAFSTVEHRHPPVRGKLARALVHPRLGARVLESARAPVTRRLVEIVRDTSSDACVISDRTLLFAVPEIRRHARAIIDWCDCFTLQAARALRLAGGAGRWRSLPGALAWLLDSAADEAYYPRLADLNLASSPVDARWLARLSRGAAVHVVPNGVETRRSEPPGPPIPGRLIFSGAMGFPPNYESALWFIDRVMPWLRRERRDLTFVAAGAEPVRALVARAGPDVQVPGFVADLPGEIARSALYVAPLVCGGGFKNKVVEALAAGRFVVGTSLATEFLDPSLRRLIPTADTAPGLARAILAYLADPGAYEPCRRALERAVVSRYTWERCARDLVALAATSRPRQELGPAATRARGRTGNGQGDR